MNSTTSAPAARLLRRSCFLFTVAASGLQSARADLVAYWDMNTPGVNGVQPDVRAGLPARLLAGAVLTPDGEGRSASAGDKAARFGIANQRIHLVESSYLTAAASGNVLSVSFWIKQVAVRNSTALSFVAPSTLGGRGFQAHAPWSDNNVYFDTGGCCDGTMRTNAVSADFNLVGFSFPFDFTQWHQVTLVKDGDNKFIYLDGVLLKTGVNTAPISVAVTDLFIGNAPNTTEAVNGDIDDFAVYSHALSVTDAVDLATGVSPTLLAGVTSTDSDSDLLPDQWELRSFPGDLTQLTSPAQDKDSDGLSNSAEFNTGTNPGNGDTDADGAPDGVETGTGVWVSSSDRGTSPFTPDTDGDGLLDGVETNTGTFVNASNTGSNPLIADTDGDLVNDGIELRYGSNPVNALSTPILAGIPTLLAWWQFDNDSNPATAADTLVGHIGNIQGAAAYSPDAEGSTGLAGDRALRITGGGGKLFLSNAGPWVNMATRRDKLTVSFWQKRADTPTIGSSSFWFTSPGSPSSARGFQAHVPWTNSNIFFDTSGATGAGQRINALISGVDWTQWHHFVFLKDGTAKRVYIDGFERISGNSAIPMLTDFTAITVGCDQGAASISGWLDEFAIFASPLSTQDISDLATRAKTPIQIGTSGDADTDSLPDAWEYLYFPGDLTQLGAPPADFDSDGSTDANELAQVTNPTDSDSDDDSLLDGVETNTHVWVSNANRGTSPLDTDSDDDGLTDNVETNTGTYTNPSDTGTNPLLRDTDNDTFRDDVEILYGSDPTAFGSVPFQPGQTFLLAHWPFDNDSNPAAANDIVIGIPGTTTGTYSADGEGHSLAPGDRAMRFTPDQAVTVNAGFMNLASPGDAITIAFWQKLNTVRNSSAFWVTSPSAGAASSFRGLQAHAPWGNLVMYFDHSGCCDTNVHRINDPIPAVDPAPFYNWRHYAFLKKGNTKQIYLDGVLTVDGAGSMPLVSDFTTLTIGGGPAGFMDGTIDDFAVFAGGLTHAQICRLAAHESPGTVLTPLPGGGPFEITAVRLLPGDMIRLTWNSTPGCTYRVEMSDALAPGTWNNLAAGIPSAGTSTTADFNLPPGLSRIFLRVTEM